MKNRVEWIPESRRGEEEDGEAMDTSYESCCKMKQRNVTISQELVLSQVGFTRQAG